MEDQNDAWQVSATYLIIRVPTYLPGGVMQADGCSLRAAAMRFASITMDQQVLLGRRMDRCVTMKGLFRREYVRKGSVYWSQSVRSRCINRQPINSLFVSRLLQRSIDQRYEALIDNLDDMLE